MEWLCCGCAPSTVVSGGRAFHRIESMNVIQNAGTKPFMPTTMRISQFANNKSPKEVSMCKFSQIRDRDCIPVYTWYVYWLHTVCVLGVYMCILGVYTCA